MVGFEAAFRRRGLIEQPLEYAPADTHHPFVFANSDAEFDSGPLRAPPGVLGKREKHGGPPSRGEGNMFRKCSQDQGRRGANDGIGRAMSLSLLLARKLGHRALRSGAKREQNKRE